MKLLFIFAALSGGLSVILGAFAAHGLKARISPNMLDVFQTGVHYQMAHSLAILLLVILYRMQPNQWLLWSGIAMAIGIVFFSGSLYALALTQIKWFGPITPLGGLCFILGWVALTIAAVKSHA
jgi:uncharacterized membrane protein YgdD (TMEM256/DUF423 family)